VRTPGGWIIVLVSILFIGLNIWAGWETLPEAQAAAEEWLTHHRWRHRMWLAPVTG